MRARGAMLGCALVLLAGCGGTDAPQEDRLGAERKPPRTILVAALGDSITAGTPFFDPYGPPDANADPEGRYEYWAQRKHQDTRFRNCGINGQRTDEIARRLEDCVKGADVLIVQGGINDIAQGRPIAAAAKDLEAMVRRGKELGLRVGIVELLPWNNGYPMAAPLIARLNRSIARIARRRRIPLSPWYRRLEDPKAPGRMRRDLTVEGDHPSVRGYRLLGESVRLPG